MLTSQNQFPTPRTRAEIARENGAKSRGPVTAEGKARSSQNALTHSLTASTFVCNTPEDQERYIKLHESYTAAWRPINVIESDLVEEMTVAKFQERRCREIFNSILDWQIQKQAAEQAAQSDAPQVELDYATLETLAFMELADESRVLPLLLRYSSEHNRHYHRAMRQLIALRSKDVFKNDELRNEPRTASKPFILKKEAPPDEPPAAVPAAAAITATPDNSGFLVRTASQARTS